MAAACGVWGHFRTRSREDQAVRNAVYCCVELEDIFSWFCAANDLSSAGEPRGTDTMVGRQAFAKSSTAVFV